MTPNTVSVNGACHSKVNDKEIFKHSHSTLLTPHDYFPINIFKRQFNTDSQTHSTCNSIAAVVHTARFKKHTLFFFRTLLLRRLLIFSMLRALFCILNMAYTQKKYISICMHICKYVFHEGICSKSARALFWYGTIAQSLVRGPQENTLFKWSMYYTECMKIKKHHFNYPQYVVQMS